FDVAVHRVKIVDRVDSDHGDRAVYRADVFHVRSARNADKILDGDLNAFVLRVMRRHGDRTSLGGDIDRDAIEIGLMMLGSFDGADFDRVAVPALYLDGAVHILQFKRAAGLERVNLVEFLTDCSGARKCGEPQDERKKSGNEQALAKHGKYLLRERI